MHKLMKYLITVLTTTGVKTYVRKHPGITQRSAKKPHNPHRRIEDHTRKRRPTGWLVGRDPNFLTSKTSLKDAAIVESIPKAGKTRNRAS